MSRPSSPTSSRSSSPPLTLDPATQALLDSFLSEKAEEEKRFRELAEAEAEAGEDEGNDDEEEVMMNVDEYRKVIGENFGMSQFWYSTPFANRLASSLHALCTPSTRVAFLSSPTGYVAFQSQPSPLKRTLLFEYDDRFEILPVVGRTRKERRERKESGRDTQGIGKDEGGFVKYDLYEPLKWGEGLRGTVDLAVIDPPYLNEKTNGLVAQTLRALLAPNAKLLILTSTSVSFEILQKCYDLPQLGRLRRCEHAKVVHEGGRIQNPFGMWATWEGSENFMADPASSTNL
ncbi:Uncharacterized conserved protein [Phaffia rhodozyma]|uniref:Uncharacterized conserved protein n=1 Tax=Phaffia rhodozyma TaxID=264483 RepID=A0A0F7SEN9_PHARH|nr:Uncharacterized conserved protein [Phaffia rhodozyma]